MVAGFFWFTFIGEGMRKETNATREFCQEIRREVEGAPLYMYGEPIPTVDFNLRRLVPAVPRNPGSIDELFKRHRSFFVIGRNISKDGTSDWDKALADDPRFKRVAAAQSRDLPLCLYRAGGEGEPMPSGGNEK